MKKEYMEMGRGASNEEGDGRERGARSEKNETFIDSYNVLVFVAWFVGSSLVFVILILLYVVIY